MVPATGKSVGDAVKTRIEPERIVERDRAKPWASRQIARASIKFPTKTAMASILAKKLGVKTGMRAILVHAPADVSRSMGPATLDLRPKLTGSFDFIHAFLKLEKKLESAFPGLKRHLEPTGMLWISWPKKGHMDTDLSMTRIIKIGYDHGLVESKCVSVNPVWSGIKFTFPKKGKTYHNSYGQLKR